MSQPPALREAPSPAVREPMPPDIHNVYIFEVFNTTSWSIVLGSPMLLFFQHLNATATILAIAASIPPVLTLLQIPSAYYVEKIGYRRFVLAGWTTRSFLVLGMTGVAFLPDSVDKATCIVLMLCLSFVYNASRGISSCGFLPWFTHIVPESRRGEFLAKDQMTGAMAQVTCLFLSATLLQFHNGWPSFGILFFVSALAAFASLVFLRRVPDVPVEKIVQNPNPTPWLEMLFYPPFFKYIRFNMIVCMALGSSNVFWVRYFRTILNLSNSSILYIACATMAVLASILFLGGPLIDRAGSKPALTLSGILFAIHFAVWGSVAAGLIPFGWSIVIIQIFISGPAAALWNLANVRMVMGIVPHMGRPHFLALYTVGSSLSVAIIPLLWGPIMDYTQHWHLSWGVWQWNSYSMFYLTLSFIMCVGLFSLRSVAEPATMTWDVFMRELMVNTPSRAVSRLITRLRGSGVG